MAHDQEIAERLRRIEHQLGIALSFLDKLMKKGDKIMATLADVLAKVAEEKTDIDSLVALTSGLQAQLNAVLAGNLPPAVQAQVDAIFANVSANAAEVVAALQPAPAPAPAPADSGTVTS